jgi:hypothetical protein
MSDAVVQRFKKAAKNRLPDQEDLGLGKIGSAHGGVAGLLAG